MQQMTTTAVEWKFGEIWGSNNAVNLEGLTEIWANSGQ
jgi:hypothetical protein